MSMEVSGKCAQSLVHFPEGGREKEVHRAAVLLLTLLRSIAGSGKGPRLLSNVSTPWGHGIRLDTEQGRAKKRWTVL